MALPKVKFVFDEFMQEHGLSGLTKAALAKLLCVSVSSVQKWAQVKKIPADYLEVIAAITEEDIKKMAKPKKWHEYDLRVLRKTLGMSQTELAKHLKTCQSSISEWEHDGRIPCNCLPFAQELKKQLPKRQECA